MENDSSDDGVLYSVNSDISGTDSDEVENDGSGRTILTTGFRSEYRWVYVGIIRNRQSLIERE